MTDFALGFLGLGQMGGPMAANIALGGFPPLVFDVAGTQARAPADTIAAATLGEVAEGAETVFLSLPDGAAVVAAATELLAAPERRARAVVDLSTIGPGAAREAAAILEAAGITYVDAPVSGGAAGARAATITVMWAGPEAEMKRLTPVLESFSGNVFHVGDKPGQGQALKILNNFLSATAMAATSEAVLYGLSEGLEMKTVLDVVNVSTGRNSASLDKFPARIVTGSFDAGFKTALLAKDVGLFLENARAAGLDAEIGTLVADIWRRYDEALPDSDFTRIYEFIRDGSKT